MPISEQRQQLYAAIGEAITAWTAVEYQLALLFCHLVAGDSGSAPANAAFHAVINFNSKLDMTDSAAQWHMRLDQARWHTFYNRLKRAAKKRNELAHFAVRRTVSTPQREISIRLAPHLADINAQRHEGPMPAGLDVKDILQRTDSFKKLASDLSQFLVKTGAVRPMQLDESLRRFLGLDEGDAVV